MVPFVVLAGVAVSPSLISAFTLAEVLVPRAAVTEAFTWIGTALALGVAVGASLAGKIVDISGANAAFLVATVGRGARRGRRRPGQRCCTCPPSTHRPSRWLRSGPTALSTNSMHLTQNRGLVSFLTCRTRWSSPPVRCRPPPGRQRALSGALTDPPPPIPRAPAPTGGELRPPEEPP